MLITDFKEIVIVQMNRQGKNWRDLAAVIGKSDTYTKQVVSGMQSGPKAEIYRQLIADNLGIAFVRENAE
ncbi:hypothetical protein [Enterococcus sp. AZ196]|uniref:hypothetical protein n=1 Tax=Enterococcus sp. AZ196 TaxID=2774659 RepID=UPI003D26843C